VAVACSELLASSNNAALAAVAEEDGSRDRSNVNIAVCAVINRHGRARVEEKELAALIAGEGVAAHCRSASLEGLA